MGTITMVDFADKEVKPWEIKSVRTGGIWLERENSYAKINIRKAIDYQTIDSMNLSIENAYHTGIYSYDFGYPVNVQTNKESFSPSISSYVLGNSGKHLLLLTVCDPYKIIGYKMISSTKINFTYKLNNHGGQGALLSVDERRQGEFFEITVVRKTVDRIVFSCDNGKITYTSTPVEDQRRRYENPYPLKVSFNKLMTDIIICPTGKTGEVLATLGSKDYKNLEIIEVASDHDKIESLLKTLCDRKIKAVTSYDLGIQNRLMARYHINFAFELQKDGSVITVRSE